MSDLVKQAITGEILEQAGLGKGALFPEILSDPDRRAAELPFVNSQAGDSLNMGSEGIKGKNHNPPSDIHPGE